MALYAVSHALVLVQVRDIMQFLLIAALVIFAYGCGVNHLYWYYAEQRVKDCDRCRDENRECSDKDCNCDKTLSKYVSWHRHTCTS